MNGRAGQGGFSLVEVLVALVVVSLILAAITTLTWSVGKLSVRARADMAPRENILAAERVFRTLILASTSKGRVPNAEFVGSPSRLSFLGGGLPVMMLDEPQPMSLEVTRDAGTVRLVISWRDPVSDSVRTETVLDGAAWISFSYFGAAIDETPSWRSVWETPQRPPEAVLLRVVLPGLGGPVDFVARHVGDTQYQCVLHPAEEYCLE